MQTIALASTQLLQPIWSLATAPSASLLGWQAPSQGQSVVAAVVSAASHCADTPQKTPTPRAALPLLEEMLESPVTAAQPADNAMDSTCSTGRHALHMGSPMHCNNRQQTAESLQPNNALLSCSRAELLSSQPDQSPPTVESPLQLPAQASDTEHVTDRLLMFTAVQNDSASTSLGLSDSVPATSVTGTQLAASCDRHATEHFSEHATADTAGDEATAASIQSGGPLQESAATGTCMQQQGVKGLGNASDCKMLVLQLAASLTSLFVLPCLFRVDLCRREV